LTGSLPSGQAGPPSIIALLDSGSPVIRRKAAHVLALQTLKSPEAAGAILRALSGEQDKETRRLLTKALAMPEIRGEGPQAVLAAALGDSRSEVVRLTAVEALRRLIPPPSPVEAIWETGLHDDSAPVRQSVAHWIRESVPRGRKPLPLILRMLRDPEPSIRRLGLETLRRSGARSKELMQNVAKAQRDPDAGVRCRAAEALVETGALDRLSIALLIGDLKKDDDTALCAEDVLGLAGLFDPHVVRSMIRLVQEEKDPDLRSRAARVLMHLGSRAREGIPVLLHAQKDDVPGAGMALKAIRAAISSRRN
jgi:HEAT repeat protein